MLPSLVLFNSNSTRLLINFFSFSFCNRFKIKTWLSYHVRFPCNQRKGTTITTHSINKQTNGSRYSKFSSFISLCQLSKQKGKKLSLSQQTWILPNRTKKKKCVHVNPDCIAKLQQTKLKSHNIKDQRTNLRIVTSTHFMKSKNAIWQRRPSSEIPIFNFCTTSNKAKIPPQS